MKKRDLWLPVSLVLAALWLCVIWGNSLLPGENSSQVSGWAGQLLEKILPFLRLDTEEGLLFLRKCAHFTEFAILGILLCWVFSQLKQPLFSPALWGITAAVIDETIQRFVVGRHGCLTDVLIDTAGVLTGVGLLSLLFLCRRKRKR